MAKQVNNIFTQYTWESAQEELEATILNPSSVKNIQNQLAMAATERANLDYDVTNPYGNLQKEAYLKGQMAAFQLLLDQHHQTLSHLSKEN